MATLLEELKRLNALPCDKQGFTKAPCPPYKSWLNGYLWGDEEHFYYLILDDDNENVICLIPYDKNIFLVLLNNDNIEEQIKRAVPWSIRLSKKDYAANIYRLGIPVLEEQKKLVYSWLDFLKM